MNEPHIAPVGKVDSRHLLAWATVRAGLALCATGIVLSLVGQLGLAVPKPPGQVAFLFSVGMVAGVVVLVIGISMTVVVPEESRAIPWCIACITCLGGAVLSLLLMIMGGGTAGAVDLLLLVAAVGMFLGKSFFLVILCQVARHYRQTALAANVLIYLVVEWAMFVVGFVFGVTHAGSPTGRANFNPFAAGPLGSLLAAVMAGWFLYLVVAVRRRITESLLNHDAARCRD
jgi:hypothetical protein